MLLLFETVSILYGMYLYMLVTILRVCGTFFLRYFSFYRFLCFDFSHIYDDWKGRLPKYAHPKSTLQLRVLASNVYHYKMAVSHKQRNITKSRNHS